MEKLSHCYFSWIVFRNSVKCEMLPVETEQKNLLHTIKRKKG